METQNKESQVRIFRNCNAYFSGLLAWGLCLGYVLCYDCEMLKMSLFLPVAILIWLGVALIPLLLLRYALVPYIVADRETIIVNKSLFYSKKIMLSDIQKIFISEGMLMTNSYFLTMTNRKVGFDLWFVNGKKLGQLIKLLKLPINSR